MVPRGNTQQSGAVVYRRLLRYVYPHWRVFAIAVTGLVFVAGTEGAFAMLMQPLLDGSFVERDPSIITLAPLGIIILFLVRGIASYLAGYGMAWVARRVIKELRGQIFEHLLRLPVSFFDSTPSASLISRLIYDVEQVARAATDAITIVVRDTLTVIVLLGWMFYIDWMLAGILMLGTPVIAHVIAKISRRFRRYSTRIQDSMADVTHVAEEAIEGQRVIKTFGGQEYERTRFEQANENNRHVNMRMESANAAAVPVVQLVAATAAAGVIFVATREAVLQGLSVGTFVSFVTAMMMLLAPMKRLAKINATLQKGIAAAQSIFGFLDEPVETDSGEHPVERSRGAVAYEGVSFSYSAEKGQVLKGIDLSIEPGQTVAFVGRSGSGKSTLVSLLPRFYEVESGRISVDGVDVRDIPLENLRDQMSLVSQHITLFNDTIERNIAYGRLRNASREQVEAAAEAAHAMEFIRELPQGLDTVVGENGLMLSGGQRQRIAIARALLKDAPILVLDEATSALDTESERHIQEALEELVRTRTTLVIAHRLSTIEGADLIVVMDKGRIIESGRHEALLRAGGHYASLYRMQFRDSETSVAVG